MIIVTLIGGVLWVGGFVRNFIRFLREEEKEFENGKHEVVPH
jgi:hypothetical protein